MDVASGAYEVLTTSGAVYLIDLDGSTITRLAAQPQRPQATLRRDGATVRLVSLAECTVGRSLVVTIDLRIPGVAFTARVSTPVHRIRSLAEKSGITHE
jgi:hypothetical protein